MAAGLITAGQRITAALLNSIAPLAVIKMADQSVTSSTTFVNDNALFLTLVPNATYLFSGYLNYEAAGPGTGGIKWKFTAPAGMTMRYTFQNITPVGSVAQTGITSTASATQIGDGAGAGVLYGTSMEGSITMGPTAGGPQLQWAQNNSNVTATIVHSQSYLAVWRVT